MLKTNHNALPEISRFPFAHYHELTDPVVHQLAQQWTNTVLTVPRIERDADEELRKRWGDA